MGFVLCLQFVRSVTPEAPAKLFKMQINYKSYLQNHYVFVIILLYPYIWAETEFFAAVLAQGTYLRGRVFGALHVFCVVAPLGQSGRDRSSFEREMCMRIISGSARGAKLNVPSSDMPVRPTTDRVKEALFSAIQFDIHGRVLDLFAGTGQLGLEALSRGADFAVFCDHDARCAALIKANILKVRCQDRSRVELTDYKRYILRTCTDRFDIVFVDPPYNTGLSDKALEYLGRGAILSRDALVVVECASEEKKPDEIGVLRMRKRYRYSNVSVLVYERCVEDE